MGSVILTLNAGSSSLKFAAFQLANGAGLSPLASGQIEGLGATAAKGQVETAAGEKTEIGFDQSHGAADHRAAMGAILDWLKRAGPDHSVAAVGHRVVHGGLNFVEPVLIDEAALAGLRALDPARAPPPAAQPRRNRGGDEGVSLGAAGRLFRHRLPSQPSVRRRRLRSAALLLRRRRAALWLSRPLLRVHHADS